jgi:hypothetical protein
MPTTTPDTSRTARLLELMKKGDDAFNARDFAAADAVHHPDMVAHITGNPEPIHGREAHSKAMAQLIRMFPDIYVHSDPYPIQFGSGDWITVVTSVTGTFAGEMVLPDGKVTALKHWPSIHPAEQVAPEPVSAPAPPLRCCRG